MERKKFLLSECDIPKYWYNVIADMTNKPLPLINPGTKQPLKAEDLYPLFAKACADQEMNYTQIASSTFLMRCVTCIAFIAPRRWCEPLGWSKRSTHRRTSISRTRV